MDLEKGIPIVSEKLSEILSLPLRCVAEFIGTGVFVIFLEPVNCELSPWVPIIYRTCCFAAFILVAHVYKPQLLLGAHLNPGTTLTLVLVDGFPRREVIFYLVSQLIGATMAMLWSFHGIHDNPPPPLPIGYVEMGKSPLDLSIEHWANVGPFRVPSIRHVFGLQVLFGAWLALMTTLTIKSRDRGFARHFGISFWLFFMSMIARALSPYRDLVFNTASGLGRHIVLGFSYHRLFDDPTYLGIVIFANIPGMIVGGVAACRWLRSRGCHIDQVGTSAEFQEKPDEDLEPFEFGCI